MADPIEQAILYGVDNVRDDDDLRNEPTTDDELGSDLSTHSSLADYYVYSDGEAACSAPRRTVPSNLRATKGNTGPKGVIQDAQAEATASRAARNARILAINRDMEKRAITVDDRAIADLQAKEKRREARLAGGGPQSYFGHLRELDAHTYVAAIDKEQCNTPVVIHIYEKAVHNCNRLTLALSGLAREWPSTKFLQVRASEIGFGEGSLEVLPTLLVYMGGKLVGNLVRVDLDDKWGMGEERDIRDLLASYDALVDSGSQAKWATSASDSE